MLYVDMLHAMKPRLHRRKRFTIRPHVCTPTAQLRRHTAGGDPSPLTCFVRCSPNYPKKLLFMFVPALFQLCTPPPQLRGHTAGSHPGLVVVHPAAAGDPVGLLRRLLHPVPQRARCATLPLTQQLRGWRRCQETCTRRPSRLHSAFLVPPLSTETAAAHARRRLCLRLRARVQ